MRGFKTRYRLAQESLTLLAFLLFFQFIMCLVSSWTNGDILRVRRFLFDILFSRTKYLFRSTRTNTDVVGMQIFFVYLLNRNVLLVSSWAMWLLP